MGKKPKKSNRVETTPFGLPWEVAECCVFPFCDVPTLHVLCIIYQAVKDYFDNPELYEAFFMSYFSRAHLDTSDRWRGAKRKQLAISKNPSYRDRVLWYYGLLSRGHISYSPPVLPTVAGKGGPSQLALPAAGPVKVDKAVMSDRRRLIAFMAHHGMKFTSVQMTCVHHDITQPRPNRVKCLDCGACVEFDPTCDW